MPISLGSEWLLTGADIPFPIHSPTWSYWLCCCENPLVFHPLLSWFRYARGHDSPSSLATLPRPARRKMWISEQPWSGERVMDAQTMDSTCIRESSPGFRIDTHSSPSMWVGEREDVFAPRVGLVQLVSPSIPRWPFVACDRHDGRTQRGLANFPK